MQYTYVSIFQHTNTAFAPYYVYGVIEPTLNPTIIVTRGRTFLQLPNLRVMGRGPQIRT